MIRRRDNEVHRRIGYLLRKDAGTLLSPGIKSRITSMVQVEAKAGMEF